MLPVHITPFPYENGGENIRFCPFTLILLITNTEPKKSVFVRSHCSGSVKSIVEYWSVFKNLRFCGYPLSIAFSKMSIFEAFLCRSMCTLSQKWISFLSVFFTKMVQCERGLKKCNLSKSKLNYQERNWSLKNKQ